MLPIWISGLHISWDSEAPFLRHGHCYPFQTKAQKEHNEFYIGKGLQYANKSYDI